MQVPIASTSEPSLLPDKMLYSPFIGFLRFCIPCKEFAILIVDPKSIHHVLILTLPILDS